MSLSQPNTRTPPYKAWLPYAALVFGILGLGFSGIFVVWANAPGVVTGFYRMGIATLIMSVPFGVDVRRNGPNNRKFIWIAILGGVFFAGDLALWNTSALLISVSSATLFGNTSPLWVSLGAMLFFKEKLGKGFWLGLALALTGTLIIISGDYAAQTSMGLGSILAIMAGMFYAGFFLCTQRAREGMSAMSSWWVSAAASTGVLLIATLIFGQPLTGYPALTYWCLIGLAMVTQVGAYLAVNYALGHLPASIVSPTLLGQPVLTALLAVPLLGQAITLPQVIGGAVVLAGIWAVHRYNKG